MLVRRRDDVGGEEEGGEKEDATLLTIDDHLNDLLLQSNS